MNKYTKDTHIYVTEEDWVYLQNRSEEEDLSVTQFIRWLIKKDRKQWILERA